MGSDAGVEGGWLAGRDAGETNGGSKIGRKRSFRSSFAFSSAPVYLIISITNAGQLMNSLVHWSLWKTKLPSRPKHFKT